MPSEIGTLVVVVLKARNLSDKHSFYKQDVFAQVALNGSPKRTGVDVKGGQHPVWDEEIRISVPVDSSEKNRTLEASCWAKEHKTDDLLGLGKVDITETLQTGEFDDWVKLETNGVYRGDIYLEMTFYANAPAPLTRRASKLHPKERLTRPNQAYSYPNTSPPNSNHTSPQVPHTSPKGRHLVPPSSRSPSSSPKNREDPLPPVPENGSPPSSRSKLPPSLAAGPGARLNASANASTGPKPTAQLPSILRPGNPNASSSSRPAGPPEATRPLQTYHTPPRAQTSAQPNSYVHPVPLSSAPRAQSTGKPPIPYINPSVPPISFPTAAVSDAHAPIYDIQYGYRPSQEPVYQPFTAIATNGDDDLPDPYLSARYGSPLPLPPGASRPPTQATPAPVRRDPAAEAAEIRRQAALLAEEELKQKKEQEEADAELARRLDMEFNLGDVEESGISGPAGAHMPGGW